MTLSEQLTDYVRAGGTLILQGETGRYNDHGQEAWTLKKRLGLEMDGEAMAEQERLAGRAESTCLLSLPKLAAVAHESTVRRGCDTISA